MRNEQRNSSPHFTVHHALARKDGKQNRASRRRFFEKHIRRVDAALGTQPLLIESPAAVFVKRNEIGDADDFPERRQRSERVEL